MKLNSLKLLTANETATLLIERQYTELDCQFLMNYFGNIAQLKVLREAKWSFLENMPDIFGLRAGEL